jgi:hypothetical protein
MASTSDSLNDLFGFDAAHLSSDQITALGASGCMKELHGRISSRLLPSLWPSALRAVGQAIAAALDVRLADVLVGGWNKYRELAKFADRDRYPPDQVNLVALGEHTITSTHEPRIAVLVDGATLAEIPIRIDVAVDVESATLKVQDARIREVSTGRCSVKAALSCEGMRLADEKHTFTLPGTISFGSGIPIGDSRDAGHGLLH